MATGASIVCASLCIVIVSVQKNFIMHVIRLLTIGKWVASRHFWCIVYYEMFPIFGA